MSSAGMVRTGFGLWRSWRCTFTAATASASHRSFIGLLFTSLQRKGLPSEKTQYSLETLP